MKALQTTCTVSLIAFIGFYLAGGNSPVATVADAMPEAAANAVAPELYAEASAKLAAALRAAPGSVTSADPGPLMARAEITDTPTGPKLASLAPQDIVQPGTTPLRPPTRSLPKASCSSGSRTGSRT
jgi:hypothetical protein